MPVVLSEVADRIAWITLNRPDRLNAITVALANELERTILKVGNDHDVGAVVIRGAAGNFCAGGDFAEVETLRAHGRAALHGLFSAFRAACDVIARVQAPVIAAVEGAAMAGGFELMQACDIVLVSESAKIGDSHINFGMIPGGGSTQRLARLVGRQQAMGLMLSGDRISGTEAVRLGLAYRSFAQREFDDGLRRFAIALAGRRRDAVTSIKRLVYRGLQSDMATGLEDEIAAVVDHICTPADDPTGVAAFRDRGDRR